MFFFQDFIPNKIIIEYDSNTNINYESLTNKYKKINNFLNEQKKDNFFENLKNKYLKGNDFFPQKYYKYIISSNSPLKYYYNFKYINSIFRFETINELSEYDLKKIYFIIQFYIYLNKNNIDLFFLVIFLPLKKKIPHKKKNILTSTEINSGFCVSNYLNNEKFIIVYRKEEWDKVLIHEILHFLEIDSTENIRMHDFKNSFNNKNDTNHIHLCLNNDKLLINESTTDFWAIIIWTFMITYLKNFSKYEFYNEHLKLLRLQIIFTYYQIKKINSFFKIDNFNDIFIDLKNNNKNNNKCINNINEMTNVFCYFHIKGCLFSNFEQFIKKFYNKDLLYPLSTLNIKNLEDFIIDSIKIFNEKSNYDNINLINNEYSLKMVFSG